MKINSAKFFGGSIQSNAPRLSNAPRKQGHPRPRYSDGFEKGWERMHRSGLAPYLMDHSYHPNTVIIGCGSLVHLPVKNLCVPHYFSEGKNCGSGIWSAVQHRLGKTTAARGAPKFEPQESGRTLNISICVTAEPQSAVDWLIHVPIQISSKDKTRIAIDQALMAIIERVNRAGIQEIALPFLGVGLGPLSYFESAQVMLKTLHRLKLECVELPTLWLVGLQNSAAEDTAHFPLPAGARTNADVGHLRFNSILGLVGGVR